MLLDEIRFDTVKGGSVLLPFLRRLRLEQHNGTDGSLAGNILSLGVFLQHTPKVNRPLDGLPLALPWINDDGELHHILFLEPPRRDVADDIAVLLRRGGKLQHKGRIEVLEHFKGKRRDGMVAFVYDDQGMEGTDSLNERRSVHLRQQVSLLAQLCHKGGKIAVFLIRLAAFLALGAEGVVAQNENGELLTHGGGREILPRKKCLFAVDFHPAMKIPLQSLTIGMSCVRQIPVGLGENRFRGNQPDHGAVFQRDSLENRTDGSRRHVGFASPCGDFEADMGNSRKAIAIRRPCGNILVFPIGGVSLGKTGFLVHKAKEVLKVTNGLLLVAFEFHIASPPTVPQYPGGFS